MDGGGIHGVRPERGRRRLAAALVLSLAAHALLVAVTAHLPRHAPASRAAPDVIEVELVEAPPPSAARPAPGPRSVVRAPLRHDDGAEGAPLPEGGATPGSPLAGDAHGPRRRSDVAGWFAEHGLGAEPRAPGLAVHPEGVMGPGPGLGPGPGAPGSPLGEVEGEEGAGERARRRIDGMVSEARAADLARYPDARWTDLRDRMAAGFSPPEDLLATAPRDDAAHAAPLEGWARAAERYGRTGSPDASATAEGPGADAAREGAERLGFAEGTVTLLRLGGAPGGPGVLSRLVTLVAVEQGEDGSVVRVWLLGSSGNVAHDALAMRQARGMRGTPGLEVPHVGRSDWAFTSELVEPPGGLFDANFRPVPARDRRPRLRTRIELVAIWAPAHR